ncbi:MAG: hypothetical protein Ct9H300mP16_19170 [Pseudomonadota bacterium]|nr:MAG: hypothetical protein Ct9H300mP16_19170 [Pseudomonadota bacterium]
MSTGDSLVRTLADYPARLDKVLVVSVLSLLGFSAVMVFSATLGTHGSGSSAVPLFKHLFSICVGLAVALLVSMVDIAVWQKLSRVLLPMGILLLVLLLVPGVGREVNGSTRWFPLGPLQFQPSEVVKVFVVLYLADHCVRQSGRPVCSGGRWSSRCCFFRCSNPLLLQPDYGCTAVILITVLGMLFLAGTRLLYISSAVLTGLLALGVLILVSPYRLQRVISFLDPFADPYGSGYQLVQA